MRQSIVTGLSFVLTSVFFGSFANAQVVTSFSYPGSNDTEPTAISNNGAIVGILRTQNPSTQRGFIRYADGTFGAPIVDPNDSVGYTRALGVNKAGTVVGDYLTTVGNLNTFHGFSLSGGVYSTFDIGGPVSTSFFGINDLGHQIGTFGSTIQANQAFLRVGSTTTTYSVPGSLNTFGLAVNNSDVFVGQYTDSTGAVRGYSINGSNLTLIDVPGAQLTTATSINDSGLVTGFFEDAANAFHGFFYNGSIYTSFNVPGTLFSYSTATNNSGKTTGLLVDNNGIVKGFVTSAVPEPGTVALLASSFAIGGAFLLKKRKNQK